MEMKMRLKAEITFSKVGTRYAARVWTRGGNLEGHTGSLTTETRYEKWGRDLSKDEVDMMLAYATNPTPEDRKSIRDYFKEFTGKAK